MKYTNRYNMPLSLAVWAAFDQYDHSDDPKKISTTALLKPLRAIVLARQHMNLEKIGDISQRIASAVGTAVHNDIKKAWTSDALPEILKSLGYPKKVIARIVVNPTKEVQPGQIPVFTEFRTEKKLEGWKVTGEFDFCAQGVVEDFKNTGTYGYTTGSNDKKWMMQLSIYRWLNPDKIKELHGYIRAIFSDWSSMQAKQSKTYPPIKTADRKFELLSSAETETFLRKMLKEVTRLLPLPQSELPECDVDELWQKQDIWKYYKNPEKMSKSTKNYYSAEEASQRYHDDKAVGAIRHIPGEVVACKYCDVSGVCEQAQQLLDAGRLTF